MRALASTLLALLVPVVLLATSVRVVADDSFVRWEEGRLAPDVYGLPDARRLELALLGLRSILPHEEEGVRLLRGGPFTSRELRHMEDVRALVTGLFALQMAALAAFVAAAAAGRGRDVVLPALRRGAVLTLAIGAVVGVYVLAGFESFFTAFHELFFAGETWLFRDSDTLIRVYPEAFWVDTARILAAATAAQALALLAIARSRSRAGASGRGSSSTGA